MKKYILTIGVLLLFTVSSWSQTYGTGPFTLEAPTGASNVQWYQDSVALSGETNSSYATSTAGVYWASYDDTANSCTDLFSNYFIVRAEDTGTNTDLVGPSGNSAYQWFKDDSAMSGETNVTLSFSNEATNIGTYRLEYNNGTCDIVYGDMVIYVLEAPCDAGTIAPTLSTTTASNTCPVATIDLDALHTGTTPTNTTLVWSMDNDASDGLASTESSPTSTAGTYYAYYYDATNVCYSPGSAAVTITVISCNDAPVITNHSSNLAATQTYAENSIGDVIDWNATDTDGDTENGGGLTYALTGDDAALFTIDTDTGILTWNASPDYENPMDADTDNDYEVTITVIDSFGDTDTQALTISVTDDFMETTIRISCVDPTSDKIVIKNFGTTTQNISAWRLCSKFAYTATDIATDLTVMTGNLMLAGGQIVELTGFALDDVSADLALYFPTSVFTDTSAMADFTQWGSAGNGRESVADAKGIWTAGNFMSDQAEWCYTGNGTTENGVTFWDGNDAPMITSVNTVTIAENSVATDDPILDLSSTDDNDSEGAGLTYSFTSDATNSPDENDFTINPTTGELTFNSVPDYENALDMDMNNEYQIEIQVCDSGALCTTQIITIIVTDEDEDGDGFTGTADPDDADPCVPNNAASPCCEAQAPTITKD